MSDAGKSDTGQSDTSKSHADMAAADMSRDRLVAELVDDLRPVRRVGAPWVRAIGWLAAVSVLVLVLAWFADMPAVKHKLMSDTDMWLPVVGSSLTAMLAAFAAFQLDMPDRSPLWALLPLPGVVLWIFASWIACAPVMMLGATPDAAMSQSMQCIKIIVGVSLPLSFVILWMLRRGYSLYPSLTGAVAGLGVAAAAATILNFFHPLNTAILYLLVEFASVALVVAANRYLGPVVFGAKPRQPPVT